MGHGRGADARGVPQGARLLTGARPLRVGVDGRELQGRPTGTGRYLRNLLREWSRHGADPVFIYYRGAAPGDDVLRLPGLVPRAVAGGRRGGLWWSERVLPGEALRDGIDVFFSPAYTCPLSLDVPRVTAVHDVSFFSLPHDFGVVDGIRRRLTVAASMRASHTVLTVSEFSRREIEGLFPDLRGRVVHVPHGPDDDLPAGPPREEARRRLGVEGPLVLSVGALLNRRPLPVLLRAIGTLVPTHPGLRLEVVGENRTRPLVDFDRLVRRLSLESVVRLSGFVTEPDLALRYAAADVMVALSDYEGFGLPVLEAMARGVPVVASRAPALGEIFGKAAILVEARDEVGVARAVHRVLTDSGLRTRLVESGRALAARYSWARTAERTWECLRAAAGR